LLTAWLSPYAAPPPACEDRGGFGELLVEQVCVDPERHGRVNAAESSRHHLNGNAREEQRRREDVPRS
jgi:hypothetical protein